MTFTSRHAVSSSSTSIWGAVDMERGSGHHARPDEHRNCTIEDSLRNLNLWHHRSGACPPLAQISGLTVSGLMFLFGFSSQQACNLLPPVPWCRRGTWPPGTQIHAAVSTKTMKGVEDRLSSAGPVSFMLGVGVVSG